MLQLASVQANTYASMSSSTDGVFSNHVPSASCVLPPAYRAFELEPSTDITPFLHLMLPTRASAEIYEKHREFYLCACDGRLHKGVE
jgi:hypothetical protein